MPTPVTAERLSDTIGRTPVVQLSRAAGGADVRVKLETRSPTGCFADRVARELAAHVPAGAQIRHGGDGVLTVALANALRERGAKVHAFIPESSSIEVKQSLAALGARVELTPHVEGAEGARARAGDSMSSELGLALANATAEWATELIATLQADGGRCDALALSGLLNLLRLSDLLRASGFNPQLLIAAVADGRATHRLAGLSHAHHVSRGARVVDDAFGWSWREQLAKEEGLLLSPAAAATVGIAIEHAQKTPGARVYAIASDTGERFFSLKDTFTWKS
jgi:cysteine synthase